MANSLSAAGILVFILAFGWPVLAILGTMGAAGLIRELFSLLAKVGIPILVGLLVSLHHYLDLYSFPILVGLLVSSHHYLDLSSAPCGSHRLLQ